MVHEKLGLKVQWIECDIIDENGLAMPDVEHVIVTKVYPNWVLFQ